MEMNQLLVELAAAHLRLEQRKREYDELARALFDACAVQNPILPSWEMRYCGNLQFENKPRHFTVKVSQTPRTYFTINGTLYRQAVELLGQRLARQGYDSARYYEPIPDIESLPRMRKLPARNFRQWQESASIPGCPYVKVSFPNEIGRIV